MRYRSLIAALLVLCLSMLTMTGKAWAASDRVLTYDQIKGTGLANNCPQLGETARGSVSIDPDQSYIITDMCLQPTTFLVKEEAANKRQTSKFVPTKLMTRATSTLDAVQGSLKPNSDGSLTFVEEEGLDFQAITVQMPGGERVPFLFTIKDLVATSQPNLQSINTSTDFEGEFSVPPYRTAAFLDPKGRGLTAGYDNAVGLLTRSDSEEVARANVKVYESDKGKISLQIAKVDSRAGEIAGTFESEQVSDSEFGVHEPHEVKVRGIFYARVEPDPTV